MKSVLIYTVHKAASSFLNRLTFGLAHEYDIAHYSINDDRYQDLIWNTSWQEFIDRQTHVGCFGPVRGGEATPEFPTDLDRFSIVLHLRDPRDMLTSLFYSHAYSHKPMPGRFDPQESLRQQWQEQGIDSYVLESADQFQENYEHLCQNLLGRSNVTFVRYEDLVTNYRIWLKQFLRAFRHLPMPRRKISERLIPTYRNRKIRRSFYKRHRDEFTAPVEDVHRHIRQVTPGDHKRKLSRGAIDEFNHRFRPVLDQLGYQL